MEAKCFVKNLDLKKAQAFRFVLSYHIDTNLSSLALGYFFVK